MSSTMLETSKSQIDKVFGDMEKPKILMVDDRPENLIALERLLKNMDVELYKATSGNEALKLTLHHDFALALLDIQMPGMDGYELAELLREEEATATLSFIFISAIYTDATNIFKGYEKGAFSYITKPFKPEFLINKVKLFIDKHKHEQALIEAQKILQQKIDHLKVTNKELKSFSYSVSHDLRAPLRVIDGYANILMEDYYKELSEGGQKIAGGISKNAKKMAGLIEDLLDFSRISRQVVTPEMLDMTNLFKDMFEDLTPDDESDNITFELHKLPKVVGDRVLMKRLISNLLSNAIKYSANKEKSVIEVGHYKEGSETVYYIKDNGVGFDEDYKEKLFDVFQRLHGDNEFKGSGVGLAIAQRVISHHNGKIWGESKPGEGATFYFSIGDVGEPANV